MKYFKPVAQGMVCPVCRKIMTARDNRFNAANLEQHLAKHPESDEHRRFIDEKREWRTREPQRSFKHISPLTKRSVRSRVILHDIFQFYAKGVFATERIEAQLPTTRSEWNGKELALEQP